MSKIELKNEIDKFTDQMADHLHKGKDIMLKSTPKGLKIQVVQTTTIK